MPDRNLAQLETKYRRIATPVPAPESVDLLEKLIRHEPRSMSGQPPIVWDRAEDFSVWDAYGNRWIDFSSGVLVTNAGHGPKAMRDALHAQIDRGLLHSYCFVNQPRVELVKKLASLAPVPLEKVFLLTTGAESTECAVKLARTYGKRRHGASKITIVGFINDFHGRTLGAQMAGGFQAQKDWIVNLDPDMVQVPYPDGFRVTDRSFDLFLKSLEEKNLSGEKIAGVMVETYPGANAAFMPIEYAQRLRAWCDEHDVLLIFDEVQAAFGRCGKWFGFEHYGVSADLICCGKGISSGLPLSAVIGRADVMDLYGPGEMTSTHSGNPLCCTAALASIDIIEKEGLIENAARLEAPLLQRCREIMAGSNGRIGAVDGKGLVAALQVVEPGTTTPDKELASRIVWNCVENGVMLFAPVGVGGGAIKINPPLCINEEALMEGLQVVEECVQRAIAAP
ncbi:MAG: aspartate aminotransferase family protein [Candidatus Omnitrophica bacterium]|nr:aspartate aminotransferase family protein [Candidatus Omnitrophota bacterium]